MDLVIVTVPPCRVAMCRVYILKGDGEVNEVQVEVVDSPVLKLSLRAWLDLNISSHKIDI